MDCSSSSSHVSGRNRAGSDPTGARNMRHIGPRKQRILAAEPPKGRRPTPPATAGRTRHVGHSATTRWVPNCENGNRRQPVASSPTGEGNLARRAASSMAEQWTFNPLVLGSSPRRPTSDLGICKIVSRCSSMSQMAARRGAAICVSGCVSWFGGGGGCCG